MRRIPVAGNFVTEKKWGGLPPGLAGFLDFCALAANASLLSRGLEDRGLSISGHRVTDQLTARLYSEMTAFIASPGAFRRSRRTAIDVWLDDVKVRTTLELLPNGRIEHRHHYSAPSDDAVVGLCLAILCDPRLSRGEVRLCKSAPCRRIFRRLGSKRVYCSDQCTERADRILAVARNREKRRRDAALRAVVISKRTPK